MITSLKSRPCPVPGGQSGLTSPPPSRRPLSLSPSPSTPPPASLPDLPLCSTALLTWWAQWVDQSTTQQEAPVIELEHRGEQV